MNRFFTLIACLLFVGTTIAQQHVCGVSHEDQRGMVKMIEEFNKRSQNPNYKRSADPIYIPIRFHLVAENDGTGRINASQALEQMAVLIADYKKVDMHLYLDEGDFNYLDNTNIYNNPGGFGNTIISRKDDDAVNIFVTENANTPGGQGTVLGFYSPSGDYIIIRIADVSSATASLSHELGHLFNLPHTFFGWEGGWDPSVFNGQVNISNAPGTNIPVELVDGSNCTVAADRICDTPPDYNFGFGWNGCNFTDEVLDRNGDLIDPMERNFMGYFIGCEPYEFTQGQVDVMFDNYNSSARNYMRRDYVPDTTEIISNHEILEPSAGEKLDYFTDIYIDWTEAEGASRYLVTVSAAGGERFEYFIEDKTQLLIDELTPNKFYFFEVQPYNDGNTDAEAVSGFFTTGNEEFVSTQESNLISDVRIYPNPNPSGQRLNVSVSIEKNLDVQVSLINITGATAFNSSNSFSQGVNTLSLETSTLPSGIYILKLDTEDGSTHKKVVIQ